MNNGLVQKNDLVILNLKKSQTIQVSLININGDIIYEKKAII